MSMSKLFCALLAAGVLSAGCSREETVEPQAKDIAQDPERTAETHAPLADQDQSDESSPEEAVEAYDSETQGAIQVKVDNQNPTDWFDVLQNGARVFQDAPKILNGTLELAPGTYEVDVNKTRRTVTVEAGRKTILWTGELVVEGEPSTMPWYAMQGETKLTSTGVEPLLNRASPLLPGTYTVFVDTSLTGQDQSLGEATVTAGQKTVLMH